MTKAKFSGNEMRLYSPDGHRLYLNKDERTRFLEAAKEEGREDRLYCSLLHYTGARPSEILGLTPDHISFPEQSVIFRTLKKRRRDQYGNEKLPEYRSVPVPVDLIDQLDLVFDIRSINRRRKKTNEPIFHKHRSSMWRMVKRVMDRAKIDGRQATPKGLRHGFGIAMLEGDRPLPIHIVSQLLGHSDTKTTEIYLQATGKEKRRMVIEAWDLKTPG